jgi:POT family proton-dependent oligopeptide transporter
MPYQESRAASSLLRPAEYNQWMYQWGLSALCAVEFLERFANYVLIAILALYLTEHRGMTDDAAAVFLGNFFTLIYLAPVFGGIVADRVLGQARAMLAGAVLLGVGYTLLVFHESGTLYPALFALIAGHGFFKPTLPAVLANRYPRLDSGREFAFIALFLAIQLGSSLAPLAGGLARLKWGWGGSFATASAAISLALVLLIGLRRQTPVPPQASAEPPSRWSALAIIYLIYTLYSVAVSLFAVGVPFFARDHVDLTLGGRFPSAISPQWLLASEPAFQSVLAPAVLVGLIHLRRRRIEPSVVAKVGIGMVLMVLPCLLMALASLAAAHGQPVSVAWVLGAFLASALPKLFLLPVLMALISQLVPSRHLSAVFGIWYLMTAVSNRIAAGAGATMATVPAPIWYGGLGFLALVATCLWISQVRRLEAALRP